MSLDNYHDDLIAKINVIFDDFLKLNPDLDNRDKLITLLSVLSVLIARTLDMFLPNYTQRFETNTIIYKQINTLLKNKKNPEISNESFQSKVTNNESKEE